MSTPPSTPPRALFAGLIDDAAVFPPGSHPLPEAIRLRAERRGAPYADLVGPLLLPPGLVPEALESATPLTIAVVGRPEVPLEEVLESASHVRDSAGHSLAGVEIGYIERWRDALDLGVPVAVELAPASGFEEAMADLGAERSEQVRAKLRTGSTPTNPVPSPAQLAAFIGAAIDQGTGFKLTGGMHRAVSHRAATPDGGEDQLGFLNVLIATDHLLTGGELPCAVELVAQRDHGAVVALVRALDRERVLKTRNAFHSYGCCDVLDPIHDLSDLRLIEESL